MGQFDGQNNEIEYHTLILFHYILLFDALINMIRTQVF